MVRAIKKIAIQRQIQINNDITIDIYLLQTQPKIPGVPWSRSVT